MLFLHLPSQFCNLLPLQPHLLPILLVLLIQGLQILNPLIPLNLQLLTQLPHLADPVLGSNPWPSNGCWPIPHGFSNFLLHISQYKYTTLIGSLLLPYHPLFLSRDGLSKNFSSMKLSNEANSNSALSLDKPDGISNVL